MTGISDRKWLEISARHRRSVDAFLAAASGVRPEDWTVPVGDGKWSPAQIVQHVIQTYEVMTTQLKTGEGLRVQTGWLKRHILRVAVLRPIMWTRRLPSGAKAPRNLRPIDALPAQGEAAERLRQIVDELESDLNARRGQQGVQLTHHLFGPEDAHKALDFIAVHTEHHGRQLEACLKEKTSATASGSGEQRGLSG